MDTTSSAFTESEQVKAVEPVSVKGEKENKSADHLEKSHLKKITAPQTADDTMQIYLIVLLCIATIIIILYKCPQYQIGQRRW